MTYETILVEKKEKVGLITLNRPDTLNALTGELMTELIDALTTFDADKEIGAIVITGSERVFAAGADIGAMAEKSAVDQGLKSISEGKVHTHESVMESTKEKYPNLFK